MKNYEDVTITLKELLLLKFKMQNEAENWQAEASEDYYNGFLEALNMLETFMYNKLK